MVTTSSEEILRNATGIGAKAVRLAELIQAGFTVPPFVVIRAAVVEQMGKDSEGAELILINVTKEAESLNTMRFAVRSAALSEDQATHSQAGQFKSLLNIKASEIGTAIMEVIHDAQIKGSATDTKPFSIIIQKYIEPEYAGVVFTRNPIVGREMIVEWTKGTENKVVGGGPVERVSMVHNSPIIKELFPGLQRLTVAAEQIEKKYNFPQDIEWVLASDHKLYIVQTRPVTTVSRERYEGYCFIEQEVKDPPYYFDQTTLSEAFVQSTPLSYEILQLLHTQQGAIGRVYKSLQIEFKADTIFREFVSHPYIDKEKEIKQFFPAYSYFGGKTLTPHVGQLSGIWTSHKNIQRFKKLPLQPPAALRAQLRASMKELVEELKGEKGWALWLVRFDQIYEQVFMVNVLADKALKIMEALTSSIGTSSEFISLPLNKSYPLDPSLIEVFSTLLGNSINIGDESPFTANSISSTSKTHTEIEIWSTLLPAIKEKLQPTVVMAQEYAELREEGRRLSVLAMNGLRKALIKHIEGKLADLSLVYFLHLDEIKNMQFDSAQLEARKKKFEAESRYILPSVIASVLEPQNTAVIGVSTGVATGFICDLSGPIIPGSILLVDRLVPELTQYMGTIAGIISREGGILSHLAIVAREYQIPVVIDHSNTPYKPGTTVTINGSEGSLHLHPTTQQYVEK